MTDMMLYLDNAPKRAIRLASLVVALILCTNVWADDDTAVTDPQCEGDDVPKADSPSHDPSSFAAGCGANANGDGSVAIGHKATTERVNVDENLFLAKGTVTVEGKSIDIVVQYDEPGGKEIGYYYDKNKDGKIDLEEHDKAESIAAIVHTLDPIPDDSLVPDHMLDVKGTTVERLEEIVPVKNAVAIGPNAAVKGDGGIALGNGATVGRDGKVIDVAVVKEDDVIANGIITVEGKSIDIVVQYDEPGGKEIGYYYDKNKDGKIDLEEHDKAESIAAIVHTLDPNPDDSLVPDHMLDVKGTRQVTNIEVESMVVDDIPATNGIAIGNGAAVMGDNGIAIGAGAEAEKNQIVIGTSDHSVAMIAGVDIKKARGRHHDQCYKHHDQCYKHHDQCYKHHDQCYKHHDQCYKHRGEYRSNHYQRRWYCGECFGHRRLQRPFAGRRRAGQAGRRHVGGAKRRAERGVWRRRLFPRRRLRQLRR